MTITTAKWTLNDYHRMVDAGILDGRHVELLHGEIIEMSPEGPTHADLSGEAGAYLGQTLGGRAKIRDAKPITLPIASEPEPDIAVVEACSYREYHPYPEQIFWLIEFANTSLTKDLEIKRKTYADVGIIECWVVNLKTSTMIVFRTPLNGDYQIEETVTRGIIHPVAFPDISISVEKILP